MQTWGYKFGTMHPARHSEEQDALDRQHGSRKLSTNITHQELKSSREEQGLQRTVMFILHKRERAAFAPSGWFAAQK
jgi:hypothetical protein